MPRMQRHVTSSIIYTSHLGLTQLLRTIKGLCAVPRIFYLLCSQPTTILFVRHLKAQLYKEVLILRRDYTRVFAEFLLPLILALSQYMPLLMVKPLEYPEASMLSEGHESSTNYRAHFSEIYKTMQYGACSSDNNFLGVTGNNKAFLAEFKQAMFDMREFADVDALKEYAARPKYNSSISDYDIMCLGIEFNVPSGNGHHYSYTLYTDKDIITQTSEGPYDDFSWLPDEVMYKSLRMIGTFQAMIDSLISKAETKNQSTFVEYAYAPMKQAAYTKNLVPDVTFVNSIGMLGIMAGALSLYYLVARLQTEKVNKIRDFMRIMGMKDCPYYLAYFIFQLAAALPPSLMIAILTSTIAFKNTNVFIIWLSGYMILLSIFPFAIIVNAVFKDVLTSRSVSILIYLCGYIFLLPTALNVATATPKMLLSLSPPIAYCLCVLNMYKLDQRGSFAFSDISTPYFGYTVGDAMGFLLLDFVLYTLLGLYLDNVIPGINGVRRPLYYFLTSSYWSPTQAVAGEGAAEDSSLLSKSDSDSGASLFEPVDPGLRAQEGTGECLDIRSVSKVYDDGTRAVNKLSMKMYKGQVFILLGHNGAGKTTTLSMLTGLLMPTSGKAMIQGADIFQELDRLRGMLGICPQDSIFYENLTVAEHLEVFSQFKGVEVEWQQLEEVMHQLDFSDSKNTKASVLSGGQKRKLAVMLSLLGDPQILMLDEPTSGLDASARQKVWDVIRSKKQNIITLMTTHYMDEAEELGDRIAIMSEGEMKCCGSPLFLKNRFGTGYNLTLVKAADQLNEADLATTIKKHIPAAEFKAQTSTEVSYKLPFEAAKEFPGLFSDLDASLPRLGISSYGVTITSLEEVFLRVGTEEKKSEKVLNMTQEDSDLAKSFSLASVHEHSTLRNIMIVVWEIWLKTLRSARLFASELVMPLMMYVLAIVVVNTQYKEAHSYTYGPTLLPTPQLVPVNDVTRYNQSTATLWNVSEGYVSKLYQVEQENVELSKIMSEVDDVVYTVKNTTKLFGSYYIESYNGTELQALVLGNIVYPHMPTVFANLLTNKYLRAITKNPDVDVTMTVTPIKMYGALTSKVQGMILVLIFVFYAGIAFSIPATSIVYTVVKERKDGLRSIMRVHGLTGFEFWAGQFIADITKIIIPAVAVVIFKEIMDIAIPYFALVLIVTLIPLLPFNYLLSFMFKDEKKSQVVTMLLETFLGGASALVLSMLKTIYAISEPRIFYNLAIPDFILRLIPIYNMISTLGTASFVEMIGGSHGNELLEPYSFYYLGEWALMCAVSFVGFFLLVLLVENRVEAGKNKGIE